MPFPWAEMCAHVEPASGLFGGAEKIWCVQLSALLRRGLAHAAENGAARIFLEVRSSNVAAAGSTRIAALSRVRRSSGFIIAIPTKMRFSLPIHSFRVALKLLLDTNCPGGGYMSSNLAQPARRIIR